MVMTVVVVIVVVVVVVVVVEVLGRTNRLLSSDTTWTAQKTTGPTILKLLGVYSLPP
jgi:hypothetical protein